jgi:hypothetical protein
LDKSRQGREAWELGKARFAMPAQTAEWKPVVKRLDVAWMKWIPTRLFNSRAPSLSGLKKCLLSPGGKGIETGKVREAKREAINGK